MNELKRIGLLFHSPVVLLWDVEELTVLKISVLSFEKQDVYIINGVSVSFEKILNLFKWAGLVKNQF